MKQAKEFFLRRIAVVLAVLMVVVMLSIGTPATATETVPQEEKTELAAVAPEKEVVQTQGITADGLEYEVYSDHIEIYQYTGSATELVILAEIEGLPVTSLNYYGIWGCENLTTITFPSTITYFSGRHFRSCKNLQNIIVDENNPEYCSVEGVLYDKEKTFLCAYPKGRQGSFVIPDIVIEIGSYAFEECTNLNSITIPDSVTDIGQSAFTGCTNLTSITIPDSVVGTGWYAFSGCTSLTSVTIPGSLSTVEEYAFNNCTSLTSVTMEAGVKSISYSAFSGCSSLTNVKIPSTVTYIGGEGTWGGAFEGCASLQSITLPYNLEYIGSSAFRYCSGLQNIEIPASVTYIADGVFYGCSSMASVQVDSANTNYASKDGILYDKGMSVLIYCPDSKQGSITLPDGVAEIEYSSFANCVGLTSIAIPDSVTSIGSSAFYGCTSLTNINIPDGVTDIGSDTFNRCSSLTSISIPSSVTSIGSGAFYNCTSLESISIPEGMCDIYGSAFFGCSSLKTISIPDTVTYLGAHAFDGCSSLASFTMPEGESGIRKGTFNGCSNLKEITIHEGVTWISYYSFVGCDSLSDVYYGGSRSGWKAISIGSEANEDLLNATIHYAKPDVHDTLDELTEEDYMLFSILAYRDLSGMLGNPTADPVTEPKTIGEYYASKWDKVIPSSDGDLGHLKATYAQVFGGISNWFPTSVRKESNGFGATIFGNATGDYVIAYCGSLPPNKWFNQVLNAGNDWLVNDLPMELFDIAGPQVNTAIGLYESVSSTIDRENIAVTGHSLGGGLGNIVSAYSGCKGVTFNAITCLDTAYDTMPG